MIFSDFVKVMEEKGMLQGDAQQGLILLKFIIDGLTEEKRRHILYLLMRTPGIHLCGIRKVFGYNKTTVGDILLSFELNGLIRKMTREEKQGMRKYRVALKLTHHHFDETDFYVLTPAWREVLATVAWDELIDALIKSKTENWAKELYRATHTKVQQSGVIMRSAEDQRADDFIALMSRKIAAAFGDDFRNYRDVWFSLRKDIREWYIEKLRGKNVENILKECHSDVFIRAIKECFENENVEQLVGWIKEKGV